MNADTEERVGIVRAVLTALDASGVDVSDFEAEREAAVQRRDVAEPRIVIGARASRLMRPTRRPTVYVHVGRWHTIATDGDTTAIADALDAARHMQARIRERPSALTPTH